MQIKPDLIKPDIYYFYVMEAQETVTQKGNAKMDLKLKIWGGTTPPFVKEWIIYDFLMGDFFKHKIKSFCYACGLSEKYESGNVSAMDCINRSGKLELIIAPARKDNVTGQEYKARNQVKIYIPCTDPVIIPDYITSSENKGDEYDFNVGLQEQAPQIKSEEQPYAGYNADCPSFNEEPDNIPF